MTEAEYSAAFSARDACSAALLASSLTRRAGGHNRRREPRVETLGGVRRPRVTSSVISGGTWVRPLKVRQRSRRVLSADEARRFYNWLGPRQDWQRFFENPAVRDMVRHAAFQDARAVIEFGCGTGRFAEELLDEQMPPAARYVGFDVSPRMVDLARSRLSRFAPRAAIRLTDGSPRFDEADRSCDRFVSTYTLDLLPEDHIRAVVSEAHRLLQPGGLIGLVSLTHGATAPARVIERAWLAVHSRRPILVGGCRPLFLTEFVPGPDWSVHRSCVITRYGMSSEVLVAERLS
jgi:SAM-dependent methyltransferase